MAGPPAVWAAYGVVFHRVWGNGGVAGGFRGPASGRPRPNTPRYPARHVSVTGDSDELATLGQ